MNQINSKINHIAGAVTLNEMYPVFFKFYGFGKKIELMENCVAGNYRLDTALWRIKSSQLTSQ